MIEGRGKIAFQSSEIGNSTLLPMPKSPYLWPQVDSKAGRTLDKKYFAKHDPVASSPQYINMREVTGRHRLPPGIYAVMPTSFEANEEAGFHLRIYSEKQADLAWV